eukprot:IDg8560t1
MPASMRNNGVYRAWRGADQALKMGAMPKRKDHVCLFNKAHSAVIASIAHSRSMCSSGWRGAEKAGQADAHLLLPEIFRRVVPNMKKPATRRTAALAAFLCITAVSAHLHAGTVWLTYGDGASRKLSTAARLAVGTHTHPRDVRGPTRDISVSGARCTVTITATNVPDSFKSAVRQAARLISDTWRSSVVVHVHLRMSHLGGADVLALSGGTPVASVRSPWKSAQTVSLGAARALRERVLYPAHADATLTLNTAARWSGSRLARVTARDIFASLFFARARSNNAASHRIDAFVRDAQGCAV